MSAVDLELFKAHVRADDFSGDDVYLEHILAVSEEAIINATRRSYDELYDMGNGEFPVSLKHAIMLMGGHLYNQREGVSTTQMHEVPDSLQALLKPFVKLSDGVPSGENTQG